LERGHIFISYRRGDRGDLVERLYDRLDAHFGRGQVFIDVDGVPVATDFFEHIDGILQQSAVVVAIIGSRWAEELQGRATVQPGNVPHDYLRAELERALTLKKVILPVLLGDAIMPDPSALPESLAPITRVQAIQLRSGPDFKTDAQRLVGALEGIVRGRPRTGAGESAPADGPRRLRLPISSDQLRREPKRLVGQRLGQYSIRGVIGAGGSGVALTALHASLARTVCVKLSFPLGDRTETLMQAIRRGMRGLVQLEHPSIAKIFDFDEVQLDDGWSFYLAQEFVEGSPLHVWASGVDREPDAPVRQLRAAHRIADALAQAHACRYLDGAGFQMTGVMHGDLKPTNVIVRRDDVPVLIDFMLVDVQRHLLLQESEAIGDEGIPITAAFGTPGFMAREQRDLGIVTAATDIFGLGCTFARAFPRLIRENGPFRDLTERMLAEEPDARPESMQAVARSLAALVAPPAKPGLLRKITDYFS
jgi:hypothetical protein